MSERPAEAEDWRPSTLAKIAAALKDDSLAVEQIIALTQGYMTILAGTTARPEPPSDPHA